MAWHNLAYVVCHYAEQQGVLIYYCGQWSMMSRKGANPFFLHPHAAHISSSLPGPPQLLDFLQLMLTLHVFILSLFADVGIC